MAGCPNCGNVNQTPEKTWKYGVFTVQAYTCSNCGTQYREYYDKSGRLSFILKFQKGRGYVKV
jgi:transposase-like protein